MATLHLKRNDTAPPLAATLEVGGSPDDLSAATVRFHMVDSAGGIVVDAAANNDQNGDGSDGTKGHVSYDWQAADTKDAGLFRGELEVTFPDGTVRTYPGETYITIVIHGDLA